MTTPQVTARAKPRIPQSTEKPKTTNVRQQQLSQNQSLKLKVVVRGLPPNLPESKFNETAAEWINENTVDWSYYVTGKLHERDNKPSVRSRAYARFKSVETLADFHKAFNGHIFTDSKGRSSRAVIELAPFQKFVKGKIKADSRQGTIDDSPEYKEFLASLNEPVAAESALSGADDGPKTTPLIEYIRNQKAIRAEKDKINKEKGRMARVAAIQAKANAESLKLQAEKRKAEAARNTVESGKETRRGVGRGGVGKQKDVQRAKGVVQLAKNPESNAEAPLAEGPGSRANSTPLPGTPALPVDANGSGGRGFRGRGRGGRARPHGVYRPGAGRGAKRVGVVPQVPPADGNNVKPAATPGDS